MARRGICKSQPVCVPNRADPQAETHLRFFVALQDLAKPEQTMKYSACTPGYRVIGTPFKFSKEQLRNPPCLCRNRLAGRTINVSGFSYSGTQSDFRIGGVFHYASCGVSELMNQLQQPEPVDNGRFAPLIGCPGGKPAFMSSE